MDAGFLKEWLGAISLVIALGGTVYAWLTSKSKVNEEHLKRIDAVINDHDRDLDRIKSDLNHLPAKDDIVEMKLALAEMKGALGRQEESMSGVTRTVRRMEEFLMKGGK